MSREREMVHKNYDICIAIVKIKRSSINKNKNCNKALRSVGALTANKVQALMKKDANGKTTQIYMFIARIIISMK